MTERIPSELTEAAFKLGSDLASSGQEIVPAIDQLNLNLAAIGCEPSVDAGQVRGSWQTVAFKVASPPFKRALRGATASIVWRENSLADSLPPPGSELVDALNGTNTQVAWMPSETFDLEKALGGAAEGAVGVDTDEAACRANIAEQNAAILKAVIGGLAANGYARSSSKQVMHEEFSEILDSLWLRGSYHCFSESKVVATIMHKAGLRTTADSFHAARRFRTFGKAYGYGLALQRLLPEAVLAELG